MSLAIEKNPNKLARYAGSIRTKRVRPKAYRVPTVPEPTERVVGFGQVADPPPVEREILDLRNALVHGVNIGSYEHFVFAVREALDEAMFDPDAFGSLWKAISASYCQFMRSAFTGQKRSEASQNRDDLFRWIEEYASISEEAASQGSQSSQPPKRIEKPLQAELIQYDDQESLCWIEVADGMRVRAKVPTPSIKAALLDEGDEFLWYPRVQAAARKEKPAEDSEERKRLMRKLESLKKRFHEELKHLDTGLKSE